MADFNLADILTKQTQYNAAKYGTGGLLNLLLSGYAAAAPNAPAARMLYGAMQTYNLGKYNKRLQQQQDLQQALDLLGKRQVGHHLAQALNDPSLENGYYGPEAAITPMLEAQGGVNFGNQTSELAAGKPLNTQGRYMPAAQQEALMAKYMQFQNDATNFMNSDAGLAAMRAGQKVSLTMPGEILNQQGGPGMGGPAGNGAYNGVLEPMTFQTGVSQTAYKPMKTIPLDINPALLQTGISPEIAANQRAGMQDTQTAMQQKETNRHNTTTETETGRHNKATEAIGQTNAQAHMIQARKPTGGGSGQPNQTTAILGLARQLNFTPAQTLQAIVDPQNFFLGYEPPPIKSPAPFGNTAGQNLKQSGSGFAAWKSRKSK